MPLTKEKEKSKLEHAIGLGRVISEVSDSKTNIPENLEILHILLSG